jgi:hypothetical protein
MLAGGSIKQTGVRGSNVIMSSPKGRDVHEKNLAFKISKNDNRYANGHTCGPDVVKRIFRVFVPGKLFQPSLLCVGKARSLPEMTTPEKMLQPYSQALHKTGKDCQGHTPAYYKNS